MLVTKNDLILEAYSKLRINGMTSESTPEDVLAALKRLTAVIASLPWNIGYLFPAVFGQDDPADDSGLIPSLIDPVSTLLAFKIAPDFGKQYSIAEKIEAEATIARQFVEIGGGKYPTTLPVGIANECDDLESFYDGLQPFENSSYELP